MKKIISLIVMTTVLSSCGDNPVYIANPDFQGQIDTLNERVDNLDNRLITFSAELTQVSNSLDSIETSVLDLITRVEGLENNVQIDRIESPCVDSDEVLVYLSDGRIMAYFEQGNKRYLSILASGTYRTTDNNNCIFTI